MRIIYKIEYPNNKYYFGQTGNFKNRIVAHCWMAYKAKPSTKGYYKHVYNAMRKYGRDNIKFSVVKKCKDSRADYWERFFIKKYNTMDPNFGYNSESGGHKNKKLSEEVKKKFSINQTIPVAQYTLEGKYIRTFENLFELEEFTGINKDVLKFRLGHATTKTKSSMGFRWVRLRDVGQIPVEDIGPMKLNPQCSKVKCKKYSTGEVVGIFNGQSAAAKALNIRQGDICRVLKGERKMAKGYTFETISNSSRNINKKDIIYNYSIRKEANITKLESNESFICDSMSKAAEIVGINKGTFIRDFRLFGSVHEYNGYRIELIGQSEKSTRIKTIRAIKVLLRKEENGEIIYEFNSQLKASHFLGIPVTTFRNKYKKGERFFNNYYIEVIK